MLSDSTSTHVSTTMPPLMILSVESLSLFLPLVAWIVTLYSGRLMALLCMELWCALPSPFLEVPISKASLQLWIGNEDFVRCADEVWDISPVQNLLVKAGRTSFVVVSVTSGVRRGPFVG